MFVQLCKLYKFGELVEFVQPKGEHKEVHSSEEVPKKAFAEFEKEMKYKIWHRFQ